MRRKDTPATALASPVSRRDSAVHIKDAAHYEQSGEWQLVPRSQVKQPTAIPKACKYYGLTPFQIATGRYGFCAEPSTSTDAANVAPDTPSREHPGTSLILHPVLARRIRSNYNEIGSYFTQRVALDTSPNEPEEPEEPGLLIRPTPACSSLSSHLSSAASLLVPAPIRALLSPPDEEEPVQVWSATAAYEASHALEFPSIKPKVPASGSEGTRQRIHCISRLSQQEQTAEFTPLFEPRAKVPGPNIPSFLHSRCKQFFGNDLATL
jgi:hypothetical protein